MQLTKIIICSGVDWLALCGLQVYPKFPAIGFQLIEVGLSIHTGSHVLRNQDLHFGSCVRNRFAPKFQPYLGIAPQFDPQLDRVERGSMLYRNREEDV